MAHRLKGSKMLRKVVKTILFVSLVLFVVSLFQIEKLPDKEQILDELYQDPIQIEKVAVPFKTEVAGTTYTITPLYSYELYGLIVSYHHSASWWDYYHKKWSDFINVKDICVIWGENIETEVYKAMKFRSESWTCYWDFKSDVSQELRSKFKGECGSNNHLLSDNAEINKAIMSAKKGDQVYLKGYLVEYSHNSWRRGTSVSRGDDGCETIYVTDFRILKIGNELWRSVHSATKYLILGCLAVLIVAFFVPSKKKF